MQQPGQVQMAQPQMQQPTIIMQAAPPVKEGWSFSAKCCLCACVTSTIIAIVIIALIVSAAAAVTSAASSSFSASVGGLNIDSGFTGLEVCGITESSDCFFNSECNGARTCSGFDCVGSSGC